MSRLPLDLAGKKFQKLTAIRRVPKPGSAVQGWLCECECGSTRIVMSAHLTTGHTRSCGCTHEGHTHGHSFQGGKVSPTYSSWKSMRARCDQPSNPAHAYYKSNGITVCIRWHKFENFLADMGERPSLAHSIDRFPNPMGNYEPNNCRWATKRQQANNRVTNKVISYRGEDMTMAELARATGLSKELLRHRISRAGWSIENAVHTPLSQGHRGLG